MSNFDRGSMPKVYERRFALAATKSRVSSSSLSKVRTGDGVPLVICACNCCNRELSRRKLDQVSKITRGLMIRLLPITENRKVFRLCPSSLVLVSYRPTDGSCLLSQLIKVKAFWRLSCLPHVLHCAQTVYVILEDLFKDFAREVLRPYRLPYTTQRLRFFPKVFDLLGWRTSVSILVSEHMYGYRSLNLPNDRTLVIHLRLFQTFRFENISIRLNMAQGCAYTKR